MATNVSLKISISDRERNFCEDDQHRAANNRKELILCTRENELDEEKPLDEGKLADALKSGDIAAGLRMIELGGVKLTKSAIDLIANCGATNVQCLRLYDCVGVTDEVVKLYGQRFGKTISHLELVGGAAASVTDAGLKALLGSIGNLEVLHLDNAIVTLADYGGTITNLRHVWSKVNGPEELEKFSEFTVKYAPYLRHLDITLSNTKDKSPEFIKLIGNLVGLTKLSITFTSNVSIETELSEVLAKLANGLTSLNLCIWTGGDKTVAAIGQLANLEQLTLNGRSPMRHIDFRLEAPIAPALAKCATKLKHLRLILKNHSKQILDKFSATLPALETLELEGLDIDDQALESLVGFKSLGFLDIVSPTITDAGMAKLASQLPTVTFLRINDFGSEQIGMKTLDAVAGEARRRQPAPIEVVFTETAKIDLETRRSMLPPNLTVSQKNSTHLVSFPGSTPRGF